MRLAGKAAIVTGAGRGIGRAVAIRFAQEGASVAVGDIDIEPASEVVAEITGAGGRATAVKIDVTSAEDFDNLVKATIQEFGKVDILANTAGVIRPALLHKMTDDQWQKVIDSHLKGAFNGIRAVAPHMMEQQSGKIICVTSGVGQIGTIGQVNYTAAKAGIIGLMKGAARELAKYRINVNCIGPGAITRMTEIIRTDERFREEFFKKIPLGYLAEPEEVAPAFAFLASDEAKYITGQILNVDGGYVM